MSYKITAGLAALLVTGFAGTALAQEVVNVNIQVEEEVSMWAGDSNVDLVLSGANAENSDAFASSISHINNIAADIDVLVDGTLPGTSTQGEQVVFYIFDDPSGTLGEAGAIAAIADNANAPAGALRWDSSNLGTPAEVASVPISQIVSNRGVVYAAAAPNFLPAPGSFALTAEWTISEAN